MQRVLLPQNELQHALSNLPGWSVVNGKLHWEHCFKDFITAFGFMTQVALLSEKLDHHPEWSNTWNRVTIDLVTHDLGNAISTWDVELARQISALV